MQLFELDVANEAARFISALAGSSTNGRDTVCEQGGLDIWLEVLRDKRDCALHEHALLTLYYISSNEK